MIKRLVPYVSIMSLLCAVNVAGAQPSFDDGFLAVYNNDPVTLKTLIDQGLDVNDRGYGSTLLVEAIRNSNNNVEIVRILMRAGASTNIDSQYMFWLALGKKSSEVRYAIIRLLVNGEEPVFRAIELGYDMSFLRVRPEYAQWLVEAVHAEDAEAVRLVLCTCVDPVINYEPLKMKVRVTFRQDGDAQVVELRDGGGKVIKRFFCGV